MLKYIQFFILCSLTSIGFGQVGTWESIPTLTEIRSILPLEDKVFLSSDGGILSFEKATKTFEMGIDGIQSTNLDQNILYVDEDSLLWIGARSPGPIIEVYDLESGLKKPIEFVNLDEINSFTQVGDSIYASYHDGLDGGLLLFRKGTSKIEYLDQFSNFSSVTSLDLGEANDVTSLDSILIFRTSKNLLWSKLGGTNLKDPSNWNVVDIPQGTLKISKLISSGRKLYIAIDKYIYEYNFSNYSQIHYSATTINDLKQDSVNPDRLVYTTSSGVYELDLVMNTENQLLAHADIQAVAASRDEIWLSSSSDFLGSFQDGEYSVHSANRPRDHLFNKMIVDWEGKLIAGAYNGISIRNDQGWRTIQSGSQTGSFNMELYDWNSMIVDTLAYTGNAVVEDMVNDHSGDLYISLQGRGVLKLGSDLNGESVFYTSADGTLEPTFDSETFVLPGQMAVDSKNNVWLTNKLIRDGQSSITILGADSGVYHINQYQDGMDSRTVKSIAIDQNDFIWVGSQVRAELQATGGIHFISLKDSLGSDMHLDVSLLSGSPPLGDNDILQLEVDAQNTLWILTSAGVQSMALPDKWLNTNELKNWAALYMTSRDPDYYYYWQLTDYNVTGIEIDQRGNKWFLSSNAGFHVLQNNGRWINDGYGYNTSNSDLLDDAVYSIAFDSQSGRAYISTSKGISVLNTPFANPREDYSDMHIYPQPFTPRIHERVVIQGLMDNSSIKIMTVAGKLVRALTSENNEVQGYEAQWDGRDAQGDIVGSGVYLLIIFNEDGVASTKKLAVLN
ncbi:MAG: T9SS type A sorting domain-containing protein [Candidatus Marinimicrobia bacterium]|nr:T9SS type A sorting domain-containing protein [Candidatus Neomarinimicrobiota bacterium]